MTDNIAQLRRVVSPHALPRGSGVSGRTVIVNVPTSLSEEWLRQLAELLASAPGATRPIVEHAPDPAHPESTGSISLGRVHMDLDQMRVTVANDVVSFTQQEYKLLKVFLEHPGRVLSRRQLLRLAWNHEDWGPGRTVDVHVRRVRLKLGTEAARLVTVRGYGYRFDSVGDDNKIVAAAGWQRRRL